MEYKKTVGLHSLAFSLHQQPGQNFANITDTQLDSIINELFGLRFKDFYSLKPSIANKRKYQQVRTYKNQINIYSKGHCRTNNSTIHIEINGAAFDSGDFDVECIAYFITRNGCNVTELHLYNDDSGDVLNFAHLKKLVDNHSFTAAGRPNVYPGATKSAPKSIYFGVYPKRLIIYEKGKQRPEDYPLDYIRLEMQLRGKFAQDAFRTWREGKDFAELAAGLIAAQVTFKKLGDKDKNITRKRIDPSWERYLKGVEKHSLKVTRKPPRIHNQLEHYRRKEIQRFIELGAYEVVETFCNALAEYKGVGTTAEKVLLRQFLKMADDIKAMQF